MPAMGDPYWDDDLRSTRNWLNGTVPARARHVGAEVPPVGPGGEYSPSDLEKMVAAIGRKAPWIVDPGPAALILITSRAAPVSARGAIDGRRFHFRSRHEGWTFTAAFDDRDPSTITSPSEGFYRSDDPDRGYEPSWLTARQAHELLLYYVSELRDASFHLP
jgi:hypothetical protein